MRKRYQISYQLKILLNIAIYVIFFSYMVSLVLAAQSVSAKITYLFVMLFFGSVAVWYEMLRFSFDAATKNMIFTGNPDKALKLADRIIKYDRMKTFTSSVDIMRLLCYRDLRRFNDVHDYVKGLGGKLRSSTDLLMVVRHTEMMVSGEQGNTENLEQAYKQLAALKNTAASVRGKQKKAAYFYCWEEVTAAYQYYKGSVKDAWRNIRQANTENMNKRELMHFDLLYARIAAGMGKTAEALEYAGLAKSAAGENAVMTAYIDRYMEEWKGR